MNVLKKVAKKVENSKIVKNPKFLVIGLIIIVVLITLIYFIFLKYSPIMNFKYEGYAISGKEITENLLGSSAENDSTTSKNIELTKIEEQGTIFKKLNDYFVGSKEKTEINLNYPIYINGNSSLYNLSEGSTLISKNFEEISGYPNLSISEGKIYDGNNLERADAKEYIFVKTTDNIYINLYEIKVKTTANEYTIPVNSIIAFAENSIRYYSINNNVLVFNQINDIDDNSNVEMVENGYTYKELLTRLGILQEESNNTESSNSQENIIQENTANEKVTEDNENKNNEQQNTDNNTSDQNGYIKPEVRAEDFTAEVYTAKSILHIKDPSGRIIEAPTFEIYKDGKIYLRRTFSNSGEIQITGLVPDTEYEVVGKYIYLNENNQKVENTFFEGRFTTKGYEELESIDIQKENGEIFSNKIQLTKVKITSDLNAEVLKGINQVEIETGEIRTVLKNSQVNELLQGKEITIESSEGLKSDSKINYVIKFYDNNGVELKVNNNEGETRTSKEAPTVRVNIKEQDIVNVTLGLKLTNRDNVELENYKYVVTRPNGEIVQEKRLSENETELLLEDLDQNQYYKISIYADYDLNDNRGKQEQVEIGNLVFATQPISTLGSLELTVENKELTSTTSTISYKINEERTDKRLIQILNELTIKIVEQPSNNEDKTNSSNNQGQKEGIVVYTDILSGEEIENLQQAGTKEIKYENLKSNTTYTIEITGNVQLGNTQETIPITYNYKEFITLKIPAKIEIRNQFVTGNLIDFDVRIEDINNAVLNNTVRMELRNSSNDLIDLQELKTNEDYIRKTYEKLEENQTYKLSFFADQYNEGSTDETYKVNYLIKEIEIITEPNILGDLKLISMERQGTGKNLLDVKSKNNWHSLLFSTNAYYGKEYIENEQILKLYAGKNNTNQYYTYNLEDYIGQTVTISFKAKLEGDIKTVYLAQSKQGTLLNITNELNYDNWTELTYTIQVDDTGYIGFRVGSGENDAYLLVKDLQIELGDMQTEYEEFIYTQNAMVNVKIENKKEELVTDKYYIRTYKNNELLKEEEYANNPNQENNMTLNSLNLELESNTNYKFELLIKVHDREYILDTQEIDSNNEELKGIGTVDEFYDMQPDGNYIITNNLELFNNIKMTGGNINFNAHINFDGNSINRNVTSGLGCIFYITGNNAILENLVLNLHYTYLSPISWKMGLVQINYGIIRNLIVNVEETTNTNNINYALIGQNNYGTLENFIINLKQPIYSINYTATTFMYNSKNGIIKNGYVYGENIEEYTSAGNDGQFGGIVAANGVSNGKIQNIYSLITIESESTSKKSIGNITAYNNSSYSTVKNVYSVNISDGIIKQDAGPNITNNSGIVENSYYFSDKTFSNSSDRNTTKLALWDIDFQNKVLNSENAFNVDEFVKQGYYPHLNMPDCMPAQEYIKLPEVEDKDLIDIVSTDILEQNSDNVTVKFKVNNPSAETITDIKIENLHCEILSQEYNNGKSEIIAKLYSPTIYVSSYDVLSITSQGAFGLPYTREYKEGERIIDVSLYRPINSIDDWKEINNYPDENYMLETDLDFRNEISGIILLNFRGKLDGNGHTIKNINIINASYLIANLYGEIHNLYIENYNNENNTGTANQGIISNMQNKSLVDGLYVNNATLTRTVDNGNIGIIAGNSSNSSTIKNSYVKNSNINATGKLNTIYAGGIVGQSANSTINNNYVQNINIQINNAIETSVGGIVGNEIGVGNISYCYATGIIQSDGQNLGGIIGKTTGIVKNSYSYVNISGMSSYIGGIVGFDATENNYYVEKNLVLGNLYNVVNTANMGRIFGNKKDITNNYAYTNQLINGYTSTETDGAQLLDANDLSNQNTYISMLDMSNNFSYDELKNGFLPKLKDTENSLLPNQDNVSFIEEKKLEVQNIEIERVGGNTLNLRLEIKNTNNYQITNIVIDDMDTKIDKDSTQDGVTYIDITATPNKYYDSYKISKIQYLDNEQEKSLQTEIRINEQFYKEIYTFEDWQNIDSTTFENYRLMADIDFNGRNNINIGINIARLEGNNHTLKNINLSFTDAQTGIINTVKNELCNVQFENISIENETENSNVGLIVNNTGEITNILFKDITINAPNADYVACITKNENSNTSEIQLNNVHVTGKGIVSGFIAETYATNFENITADKLDITGNGQYVGGIFGNILSKQASKLTNISLTNSNILGSQNDVGGIVGYIPYSSTIEIWLDNIIASNNYISGNYRVGGVSGNAGYGRHIEVNESTIVGNSYVGGISGVCSLLYDVKFLNGNVEAIGNYVGGILGEQTNVETLYDCHVIESNISSTGDNVAGLFGINRRELQYSSVENSYIKGRNNVGTLVGTNIMQVNNSYGYACIVDGNNNVGGIVGYTSGTGGKAIQYTYNNSKIKGNANIGGIVGNLNNTNMTETYNAHYIINNYAVNNIDGTNNVGGLFGYIAESLYKPESYFYRNYVQSDIISSDKSTTSIGIGNMPRENMNLVNTYFYKYSTINGENLNEENDMFITSDRYLVENDLKQRTTYTSKLKWNSNYFNCDSLVNNKYPTISSSYLTEQEGIDLPIDAEHIVGNVENSVEIQSIEPQEEPEQVIEYNNKTIQTYSTYSLITAEDGTQATRNAKLYVKDNNLYAIPSTLSESANGDESIVPVANNLIIDSYNGKEYETVLGSDGKIYELKESIAYPENFVNSDIESIGNNLNSDVKEVEVTYKNGDKIKFNYQTGEIISSSESDTSDGVGLFDYIKERISEIGDNSADKVSTEISNKYEESKELQNQLEKTSVEEAIEKQNTSNSLQTENVGTATENNATNNSYKENKYISIYNEEIGEYEIYNEEELLDTNKEEVVSENEKIEANNLSEYYASEGETRNTKMGIVWIVISIIGVGIILFILKRNLKKKA